MQEQPGAAYVPPLEDIWFVLNEVVDLPGLTALPCFEHADPELLSGVLDEAGRFVAEVVAPLNRVGASSTADATPTGPSARPRASWRPIGAMSRRAGGRCRSRPSTAGEVSRGWSPPCWAS